MNNAQKKQLRRALSGIGGIIFVFSLALYLGLSIPGVPWPFNTGYPYLLFGIVAFIVRYQIKDRKQIWTSLGFFGPHGLTKMVDINPSDVTPTHIRYKTPDGEEHKVKHFHPFAIPGEDGYDLIYLTPENTVEALNPARLFRKYAQKLTEEAKTKVMELYSKMLEQFPEAEALDPNQLTIDETENDDPDRLNQELASVVSEIKRGFLDRMGLKQNWFYIFAGVMVGMVIITFVYMGAGIDFYAVTHGH